MKIAPAMFAIATVALLAAPARAEDAAVLETAPPPKTLAVDAAAIVPVGDYADLATLGAGPMVRLEVPAGAGFVTGRLGALFHAIKDGYDANLTLIPLYAGYRHPLGPSGAYVAGELGITVAHGSVMTAYGSASDTDSELGAMLTAGVRRGALDLRAGLFLPDLDDAVGLVASAGYDFSAF